MKTALVLHGWGGNSQTNWFVWLEKELQKQNIASIIPNLPNTACPDYNEQLSFIDIYKDTPKASDMIIGHSLGGHLALAFVEKHKLSNIHLILVAPSYPTTTEEIGESIAGKYYKNLVDYNKNINTFEKLGNKITVLLSADDPFIKLEKAKEYYSQAENVTFIECIQKGHFNTSAGIVELPEILEFI